MASSKQTRFRLVVTFDIPGAKSGDARYGKIDTLLDGIGTVLRVFKQMRLVTTSTEPRTLAAALQRLAGPRSSVFISHAAKPYRFVLGRSNARAASRPAVTAFMRAAK